MKISNIEVTNSSYLFSTKLNPSKGTFPMFKERFKRKLGDRNSMSPAEAGAQAKRILADLDHLQTTSKRDKARQPNTTKDINRAIKTWLWFIDYDPEAQKHETSKRTEKGFTAHLEESYVLHEVSEHYQTSNDPVLYTEFGDALLTAIKQGQLSIVLSDAVKAWADQTNRGHLKDTHKTIADASRYVDQFTALVGDKQLDQISRKHVSSYIEHRLKTVKTTTVKREVTALRAVWNRAADHFDIKTRNPFERQPIKGLGLDSNKRRTPTAIEHATLLQKLEASTGYTTPLLAIIALTGLRLAEAWGLEQADYDEDKGILYVRPNSTRPSLKTKQSERPIPVLPELDKWLKAYFIVNRANTANSASAALGKKLETLLPDMTAHGLRHGFRDRLIEANATGLQIDELMGWSDQTMQRHYGTNSVNHHKRELVETVYKNLNISGQNTLTEIP